VSNNINLNSSSPGAFRSPTQPVIDTLPPQQEQLQRAQLSEPEVVAAGAGETPPQPMSTVTPTPPGQMGKGSSDCCGGVTIINQGGGGGGGGGFTTVTDVKTSDYTAAEGELVQVDSSGGGFAVTLPLAATAGAGKQVGVVFAADTGGFVSIDTQGSDTVNGQPSGTYQFQPPPRTFVTFISDGVSNWMIQG
jgi:hypothetical protein